MSTSDRSERLGELNRRQFMKLTGGAIALTSGLGLVLEACAPSSSNNTATPASSTLHLHQGPAGPNFQPYIEYFNQHYAPLNVVPAFVSNNYPTVTQTQLAGGSPGYDVLFADEGYLQQWYDSGWIRSIEGFPGVSDLLKDMQPGLSAAMRANDGKLVALPYYRGAEFFAYNSQHLTKINAPVPQTWDDFVQVCRELKAKGIVQTPYSPFWLQYAFLIWLELAAEATSDGAAPFFDDKLQPTFASDPVVANTLKRWNLLYKEGLVPKDIFTTDYGLVNNIFAGGKSSFTMRSAESVKTFRDPTASQVAQYANNALVPGSTHKTLSFGAFWFMAKTTQQPDNAWVLMNYIGGKGTKGNSYYVPTNLIDLHFGLASGYSVVDNDPAVMQSWSAWSDVTLLEKQLSLAVPLGRAVNQTWYAQFATQVSSLLQEAVIGTLGISDTLKQAGDLVRSKV